jgi:hypothetical protein
MKIGLHANQLDCRGNSTVLFDYANAIRDILGYEPIVVSSRPLSTHPTERFSQFGCRLYEDPSELPGIIDKEKIDVLYMTKAGNVDKVTPTNCKTSIHCVFDMREQHGDVYAGVSEWLAGYFKKELWVPHIINMPKVDGTLHSELSIPKDAFILGRLGGTDQFDLPFVHSAIKLSLEKRSDLWFIFLNTKPFIEHPRVKFLPFHPDPFYKSEFINTCDGMIHARSDGETFGLAVAEFSALNKPILTYDAPYWWYMRAHLHMLGEKAITYKNGEDLLSYLLQIDKEYVKDVEWDCYSQKFSSKNVIKQFNDIFIK